jgi:DNA-directed RNA polymerase specialized sigma subunit
MSIEPEKQEKRKSRKRQSERDEQIISQMWKASQVARKISSFTGLPYEELRDAALEYIVKIYDSWDQSKGANFSTWVNRCLQFHMLNYLRDNSRLVKIPRSYSDLYLKIRKYTAADPDISDEQIAEKIQVPVKKVRAVRQAFAMSFSPVTEYCNIIEPEYESEMTMGDFMMSHRDLLHKITDLDPVDETFLMDYLVKKRSVSTIVRKNPHLKNADDIKKYSEQLIEFILCDASYPSKVMNTRREPLKKSGQKLSVEQNATTL